MFFDLVLEKGEETLPEEKSELELFEFLRNKSQYNYDYETIEVDRCQ